MGLSESVALAVVPGVFWLWVFYRRDKWEPEPKLKVIKLFLLGALAAAPAYYLQGWLPGPASKFFDNFVRVALVEELFKVLPVLLIVYWHREFNEPMDGIVYAVAAALGFATVENILYAHYLGPQLLMYRVFTSTLLHVGCSGLVGYALGRAKFSDCGRIALTFPAVVGLHGAFDLALCGADAVGRWTIAGVLPFLLLALFRATNRACHASPFREPGNRKPEIDLPHVAATQRPRQDPRDRQHGEREQEHSAGDHAEVDAQDVVRKS